MRLLYVSDFPILNTGYAKVSRELVYRFVLDGHEVYYLPIAGLEGGAFSRDVFGAEILPTMSSTEDIAYWFFKRDCDVAIILKDPYVFTGIEKLPVFHVFYSPVAEEPLSNQYKSITQTAMYLWIPSWWGIRVALASGVRWDRLVYVPHGVSKVYRRYDESDVEKFREQFGFTDFDVVVGIVAVNRRRKFLPNQIEGVKIFVENNPDLKVGLYLHTSPQADNYALHGGWDLNAVLEVFGLLDVARFPDPYLYRVGFSEKKMAELYNAIDVLVNATTEGYGLPLIESQACGTPVVTVNHGNGPEINFYKLNARVASYSYTFVGTKLAVPDPYSIADCIEKALKVPQGKRMEIAKHVRKIFDWDVVYGRYVRRELDKLENELDPKKILEVV